MTTSRNIEVRGVPVEVVRKDVKNLHVGVYPPNGRVRVAAPLSLTDEAVRLAVVSRLGWIQRRKAAFQEQVRQTERELVTGEAHYFGGKAYRLDVIEHDGPPSVRLTRGSRIELRVRPGSDRDKRESVLMRWYRMRLREQIPPLLDKWEPRLGVSVSEVRIKRMKTRWGSCNADAGRIWLNLELAKKKQACLECVFVHEMVHLLERNHSEHFTSLMDRHMPQWRSYRDELNQSPLAHDRWEY